MFRQTAPKPVLLRSQLLTNSSEIREMRGMVLCAGHCRPLWAEDHHRHLVQRELCATHRAS